MTSITNPDRIYLTGNSKKKPSIHNVHEYITPITPLGIQSQQQQQISQITQEDQNDPDEQVKHPGDSNSGQIIDVKNVISGPVYCYLCVNFDEEVKTNTHVGHSIYPREKVKLLNNYKDPTGATEHWTLAMIVGPFIDHRRAKIFRDLWKYKSRGHVSRLNRGLFLTRDFNRKLRELGMTPDTDGWNKFHMKCWDLRKDESMDTTSSDSEARTKRLGTHLSMNKRPSKKLKKQINSSFIDKEDSNMSLATAETCVSISNLTIGPSKSI